MYKSESNRGGTGVTGYTGVTEVGVDTPFKLLWVNEGPQFTNTDH